jgi:hypothetical protein
MGRKRRTHETLAYTIVPDWVFELVANGYISSSEMMAWLAIRRYAPDRDRDSFSPPPVDVTNREVAEIMQVSTRRVRQILKSLIDKRLAKRISPEEAAQMELKGHRYMQLLNPGNEFPRKSVSPEMSFRGNHEEYIASLHDDDTKSSEQQEATTPESLSFEEGDARGRNTNPGNEFPRKSVSPETSFPPNRLGGKASAETRRVIAGQLRELGVYANPANEIAVLLVQAGITDPDQVEDMFYAVLAECAEGTDSDRKAFGRAVQRMRAGDWDTDTAQRAVQAARKRRYRQVKSGDALSDASIDDGDDVSDAERIWQRTLEDLRLQMTRNTFEQNLRGTVPLGRNGNETFVVIVGSQYIADLLENRLRAVVERTLARHAGEQLEIRFVPEEKLDQEEVDIAH